MENRIKECQLDPFADSMSNLYPSRNQLRLRFASMTYVLLCPIRRIGLARTRPAAATCGAIRRVRMVQLRAWSARILDEAGNDVDEPVILAGRAGYVARSGLQGRERRLLAEAYERTKHMPVKPRKHGADDDMRDCLGQAAARTTGIDIGTIRGWRARISSEPTVTSKNVGVK